jgi:hypothetical protein
MLIDKKTIVDKNDEVALVTNVLANSITMLS